jgi:uncharacterized SAM-binding protein YcdF (DUF218 family)
MYYLNKIVGWIVSPLGVLFIGFAVALGLRVLSRRIETKAKLLRRVANVITVVVLVFMWIMSCGITTRFISASLEKNWEIEGKPHGDISGLPNADAIVVLGGGMGVHRKCKSPEMFGSADRVWQGARLYNAGLAKVVSLSGPDVEISTVPLAEDLGVPRDAMMYFSDARNTEEESKLIYEKLSQTSSGNKPKILLVTSAWHMSRAKLLFERAGFDVVPAPTDFEMSYVLEQPIKFSDFLPSPEAMSRNTYALKEWVGNFGYRFLRK